jgi:hypothetical protein
MKNNKNLNQAIRSYSSKANGDFWRKVNSTDTFDNDTNNLDPVRFYPVPKTQKDLIFKENKGKAGVYLLTNQINGKTYIGSGVNLSKRLSYYYSQKHMDGRMGPFGGLAPPNQH